MELLRALFVDPFAQMIAAPDLLAQTIWEGFVAGVLYSLIALGFVLIYKASGVFNFAQGIMMVFAALTLVGLHEKGVPAWAALILTIAVMYGLALAIERLVLRPLVNQPDIILLMATFGVTYFLIGFGELVFGGNPKSMITKELLLPDGALDLHILGGKVELQKLDIAAAAIALIMVAGLAHVLPEDADRPGAAGRSPTIIRRRCRSGSRSIRSGSSSGSPRASWRWRPASSGARGRKSRLRCRSWR